MGLDVALGVIIFLGALRGWFRGFSSQVVRLIGLGSCVYLALPVREQARPYVLSKMPAIDSVLLDRMLWWVAAVVSYLVVVGFLMLAVQLMKQPAEPGIVDTKRGDRFGGFLLGGVKAAILAAVLAAGVHRFGAELARNLPWVERQTSDSYALVWTEKYRPIPRLWATPAVQGFVEQIQRNGLRPATHEPADRQLAERILGEAEIFKRPPRLDLPSAEQPDPRSRSDDVDLGPEVVEQIEKLRQELRAQSHPPQP